MCCGPGKGKHREESHPDGPELSELDGVCSDSVSLSLTDSLVIVEDEAGSTWVTARALLVQLS